MQSLRRLLILCRGDSARIAPWLEERDPRWLLTCVIAITAGCALYGGVVGLWRAPVQAAYTAIKMPLLIFLTCSGNALLNGMLAQILGSGLSFRQSAQAILMSFTIAALILASLSPVALFILYNAPPLGSAARSTGHSITLLSDVLFIAYAGFVANRRLLRLLQHLCPTPAAARRVFWSWLAGNLFLGAQLSWILRPFIGSPGLPVQFLRDHPLRGNFYEAVFNALRHLLS
ncbi:MAG: hypothetical protein QOE70_50 [Chthoniobacter sp.]|jgi:hypothetical protein|nr:hypothetical protein [Chthoniobacter sp.]